MPIDHWLSALSQNHSRHVDGDLAALTQLGYSMLADQTVSNQIERLSGHLAGVDDTGRRLAIAYSLYVRQMDAFQQASVRPSCAGACQRPPVGCCTADHFVILSPADFMISRPSARAMQLAYIISGLQKIESAHAVASGQTLTGRHCACLSDTGCTLRLFKSPRCLHYLCGDVENTLTARHGENAKAYIAAMRETATRTITTTADFTGRDSLDAACRLFAQGT